ncbi:Hypothetical protein CINCED_3A024385 [Cinara cedri]|uniref:Uncharacterized protein n=1 Tax=Cinara cedri TaxID=506608 RepID=A0A5E4MNR8_9HEMI|nr:Hypothetical protein CINCED_3A024385 [Cinara cedri]
MSPVKRILCFASIMKLFALVQSENCTIKNISEGVINRLVVLTCPNDQDAKFCCYDPKDNVECCNTISYLYNIFQKNMPGILILLILIVGLVLTCCVICICIPCYCMMRRLRPTYKESNDNANMIAAVSLPNESEEENTPKKEVTHHLPPGAYPVYPQFMGMQPLKSTEVNC